MSYHCCYPPRWQWHIKGCGVICGCSAEDGTPNASRRPRPSNVRSNTTHSPERNLEIQAELERVDALEGERREYLEEERVRDAYFREQMRAVEYTPCYICSVFLFYGLGATLHNTTSYPPSCGLGRIHEPFHSGFIPIKWLLRCDCCAMRTWIRNRKVLRWLQ